MNTLARIGRVWRGSTLFCEGLGILERAIRETLVSS
jgi:hypothetical protein